MAAGDALCSLKRLLVTGSDSRVYSGGHVILTMIEWYHSNERRSRSQASKKETPETAISDPLRAVDPSRTLLGLASMVPTLVSEGKGDLVLETLKKYAELPYYDKEALVLCLVVAAKQPDQKDLVTKCYSSVKQLCPTTYLFFLFIQLSEIISKVDYKTGWGRGLRRAVNDWYLSKDPKQLALEVTRYRSVHGWEHKDVIKLAHITVSKLPMGTQVVLHYVFTGLEKTKEVYASKENTDDILKLLSALNTDSPKQERQGGGLRMDAVIRKGSEVHETYGKVSFNDIPSQSLKSKEVWSHLLDKFDHESLLASVGRLSKSSLLNELNNFFLAKKLKEQLISDYCISHVNPTAALLTLHAYRNPSKYPERLKEEKKTNDTPQGTASKRLAAHITGGRNVEVTAIIVQALNTLIAQAAQRRRKPDGRMALCIDVSYQMATNTVWANNPEGKGEVTAEQAAAVTALSLAVGSAEHAILALTKGGLSSVEVLEGGYTTMADLIKKFRDERESLTPKRSEGRTAGEKETSNVNVSVEDIFKWAKENGSAVKTFVILTHKVDQGFVKRAADGLTTYNNSGDGVRSRLVVCGLSCKTLESEPNDDFLVMQGFGKNTPSIIEAFHEKHF